MKLRGSPVWVSVLLLAGCSQAAEDLAPSGGTTGITVAVAGTAAAAAMWERSPDELCSLIEASVTDLDLGKPAELSMPVESSGVTSCTQWTNTEAYGDHVTLIVNTPGGLYPSLEDLAAQQAEDLAAQQTEDDWLERGYPECAYDLIEEHTVGEWAVYGSVCTTQEAGTLPYILAEAIAVSDGRNIEILVVRSDTETYDADTFADLVHRVITSDETTT